MIPKPESRDIFAEFGKALRKQGYTSRKKLKELVDEVKLEVTKDWLKKEKK